LGLTRKPLILIASGLLVGAGLGILLIISLQSGGPWLASLTTHPGNVLLAPETNVPAPDFELANLSGQTVRLADLRGHPVVVNFWATWCGPCRLEMPLLQKYADRYPGNLRILAVNDGESTANIQKFVDEFNLKLDVLQDPAEKVTNFFQVRDFPSTFFLDTDGNIRFLHIGTLNEDQLVGYLGKLGVSQ